MTRCYAVLKIHEFYKFLNICYLHLHFAIVVLVLLAISLLTDFCLFVSLQEKDFNINVFILFHFHQLS